MSETLVIILNYIFLLPLCSLGFYFIVIKLLKGRSEFSWSILYTIYFTFLMYYYFLPFDFNAIFTNNGENLLSLLNSIRLNPFSSFGESWLAAINQLKAKNIEFYVQFFIQNITNFLILMPLTNFIYSLYKINRKECFASVFIFAVIIEIIQFLLMFFTGQSYIISILDILESTLGSAFFLGLANIIDSYSNRSE